MCTREGADTLLLPQIEVLHETVLRAGEQHVRLAGVEAHLVDSAFVFGEKVLLFVSARPRQVPGHHGAIGSSRGQEAVISLVPHDISTAEIQRRFAAHTQVQAFHKAFLLERKDLEDVAPSHNHLRDGEGGKSWLSTQQLFYRFFPTKGLAVKADGSQYILKSKLTVIMCSTYHYKMSSHEFAV